MTCLRGCILLVLVLGPTASAQNIRGTVSESGTGAPLTGAFVVLLDSAGRTRGGALSDSLGRYLLRAPYAGPVALRAELIGHETFTTTRFSVSSAGTTEMNVSMPVAAVKLEALQVSGERRCERRPESGRETARLWAEARKALTVAAWTENEDIARFAARSFERVIDPRTFELRSETVKTVISSIRPYAALPADSLARYGYVRGVREDTAWYYGPDAEVLLSEAFLDTHCFRVQRGENDAQGLIGLEFEPVRGRKLPDIKGALWLDPRTSELRFIEFRYTGMDREVNPAEVGGRTYFRRLPSGAWVVDRWYIRLPVVKRTMSGTNVIAAFQEAGGEITSATIRGSAAQLLRKTLIKGFVFDSVHGVPLRNATVYLSGTAHRALTDSTGAFTIDDVNEGRYAMAFSHAIFDSLPAYPEPVSVEVLAQRLAEVVLAVPSASSLVTRACGTDTLGTLFGYLRDKRGNALPGKTVIASYKRKNGKPADQRTETDHNGRYAFCGLPLEVPLRLKGPDRPMDYVSIGRALFLRQDRVMSPLAENQIERE